MDRNIWAGVDVGGTKTAVVLSSRPPEILCRTEFATLPAQGPQQAIDQIKAALHQMLAELKSDSGSLLGIGVSCGRAFRSSRRGNPGAAEFGDVDRCADREDPG